MVKGAFVQTTVIHSLHSSSRTYDCMSVESGGILGGQERDGWNKVGECGLGAGGGQVIGYWE